MTTDQTLAFAILGATLVLFVWARWRYDVVAVLALLAVVLTGLVPPTEALVGFSHPAVVTVAAVLIISRGLQNAGLVDVVVKAVAPLRGRENLQIAAQCLVIAVLSSFMNNVGALALMLPVALRNAYRDGYPPAKSLMPLAFASLLGGLTTLIGTPPNIIIATFRARELGQPFGMFDFTPVGVAVAAAGLVFLVLVGWRLLPIAGRRGEAEKAFEIDGYITEAQVGDDSKAAGMTIAELEELTESEVSVVGLIRNDDRRLVPTGFVRIRAGDILVLRGDADALESAIAGAKLVLVGEQDKASELLRSKDVDLVEAVVSPGSMLIGRTPSSMRLRLIHGVNLLALARQGQQMRERLSQVRFRSGDVLLLQGPAERMPEILATLQCLPLAERTLGIGRQRRLVFAGGLFALAVVLVVAGILPVHIAFIAAAAGFVVADVVKPTEIYTTIDWPVIVLLAALFPVGSALETTGGAALVADGVLRMTEGLGVVWVLLVVLVGTMFISDVINNNATAVLMAPIAATVATRLNVSADPFLMAVAIGASCAFLTPIGHQSNTLVMEPAGYRFGDYWRVGLPLEVVIAAVALPMILLVWPP
ncbi:MAG: SLC13 family permease [Rhizobiales bacterium]|nr:SLC13 family permease [Hyphomicrobiales bacterium]